MSKKLRFLSFVLAVIILISSAPDISVYAQEEESLPTEITNPFSSSVSFSIEGQTVRSNSFRIPAMVTLTDGTIVATADTRWNTTYDGGCLDTLVARSTDGGVTWLYSVANYFGDNGNEYNSQSTAFIDPCLTVAADGKTVYLLCDLYPYGIALNGNGSQALPSTDIGFTEEGYLKLSNNGHASYDYYLKDEYIYDSSNTQVAGITVDAHFNLYDEDGDKVSNLFFADSPYKVVRTGFLYLISSTDGGATWSDPKLLDLKNNTENVCLASPGSGITTVGGTMVFPIYSYTTDTQKLGFIYSPDNGATWQRSEDFDSIWASESAVVEIGEGTLRFFFRNQTAALCYVDYDMNAKTWGSYVNTGVKTNSNTQLSVITYSKTFNGNQVVLVSCPTGPNEAGSANSDGSYRTNGKIFVGVVAADGTMSWPESVDVNSVTATGQLSSPYTEDQGFFAYSCLTERADGSIAILYENNQYGWGAGVDKYFTINAKAYSSSAFGITFDSNEILSREKDGITVTGYIPDAVELQVAGVSDAKLNAVSSGLIDKSGFSEILSISGKDITLLDGNSSKPWHPGADRPVTVTVSDVWTPAGKTLPVVDVYHILDDAQAVAMAQAGGYLLTCKDPDVLDLYPQEAALLDGVAVPYVRLPGIDGGTVVNQDGSITFETDSFSDYFIVLGFTDGLSLSNNGNDTYYVEPGTTLTFDRSVTWTPQSTVPAGLTASGDTVTIGSGVAVPSEVTYTATWSGSGGWWGSSGGSATVIIKVSTRNQIVSGALKDEKYPVILSVVRNTTKIPSEPGTTDGDYSMFNSDYSVFSGWGYPEFSPSAEGIISPNISDVLIRAIDESNAIGYADASGTTILPYLTGIDWDIILEKAADNGWRAIDGTSITDANKNNYKVVPYVVKLMNEQYRGIGWHIDCAIVQKESATLSYNVNLDNYTVTEKIVLPNAVSDIPVFNASVGSITGLTGGSTVSATYNGEQMTLTFKGWNTSPDGKGTMYTPGASISISKDTVLYAIWEGELVPGELYIYKTVTAEDGATEPNNATYQFNVQFGTAGTYSYTVYNADGSTVSSGSFNTQGTIDLANGQYAVFVDIPANTTYTVTETAGSYTTTSEGSSGVIRSGGRAVARFVNHYAYIEPEVTINYIAKDGGRVTNSSETVRVNTGNALGSTANPSDGYQFTGWFRDEACTQPVDPSWITFVNHLTPQKIEGSYQAVTYYAKFEPAVTSLTISKTGHITIDENQSFLFRVQGDDVNLIVTIHGNGSTTINGLKVGGNYTVTELTDWSWRYEFSGVSNTGTGISGFETVDNGASVTLGVTDNQLTFTNSREENKWLDGDSWCDNLFNQATE